jgi:non-specific serine/threonine protein kinase/serine/threonine-protein kinase
LSAVIHHNFYPLMTDKFSTHNTWNSVSDVVARAAELPPDEREGFVTRECAGNDKVRAEAMSLLAQLHGMGDYIETPAIAAISGQPPTLIGKRIGAYVIERLIGEGGMGAVYAASRADGAYTGRVAIKLLHLPREKSLNTTRSKVSERMARERQALAQLKHPNIAMLLDGGDTPAGEPYLVMELVEGSPIDFYCAANKLDLHARIRLARGVCAAVQHAHQSLLIHRDIKPSNILVTADGTVKLLDFGIARAMEAESGGASHTIEQTALLFTPKYASPEQMRGQTVTVATDVYGIGVLLYELLAGASPYARIASGDASTPVAAMEAVLNETPAEASAVRAHRRTIESVNLPSAKSLRGDLDTILAKACAKLPTERYQTVSALDDDLRCWLEGRPIAARPSTWWQRSIKAATRNPATASAMAIAFFAMAAGTVGVVIQRNHAEERYAQVRKIANSFIFTYHDKIEMLAGSRPVIKQMVTEGLDYLTLIAADAKRDPQLAREASAGYRKLATAMFNGRELPHLNDRKGADAAYLQASALIDSALQQAPNDVEVQMEYALLEMDLGALARQDRKHDEAIALYDKSAARLSAVLAKEPSHREAGFSLPQAYLGAAQVMADMGKPARDYLARGEAAVTAWAVGREADPEVGNLKLYVTRKQTMDAIGRRNYPEAIVFLDSEITGYEAYLSQHPDHALHQSNLQTALQNKGFALIEEKQFAVARAELIRSIAIGSALFEQDKSNLRPFLGAARATLHLGRAAYLENDLADATRLFADSADRYRLAMNQHKAVPSTVAIPYADTLQWQAKTADALGNKPAARKHAGELIAHAATQPAAFEKGIAAAWLTEAKARVK